MPLNPAVLSQALEQAVCETVETMLFLEAIPAPGGLEQFNLSDVHWSQLTVETPHKGILTLLAPSAFVTEMANALFSGNETPLDATAQKTMADALAEILNTIGGRFMSQVVPDQSYQLGIPTSGKGKPAISTENLTKILMIGEHRLCLVIEGSQLLGPPTP